MKISLVIFAAACASTTAPAPSPQHASPTSRGLHADDHLDAAREHTRRADELSRWPQMRHDDIGRFDDPKTGLWYRELDQSEEHRRQAEGHRAEAAQIQAAYDEACANVAPERVRVSPLQRYGLGGMPTAEGVVVYLDTNAGPPDRLLEEIQCHRAWMRFSEAGMEHCPLDLPGLRVVAHGDDMGISVELRVKNKALVPELQRRAAHDLEVAKKRSAF